MHKIYERYKYKLLSCSIISYDNDSMQKSLKVQFTKSKSVNWVTACFAEKFITYLYEIYFVIIVKKIYILQKKFAFGKL